jgi:putative sporulation protein YtaF
MLPVISISILALAVSLDGFGVGVMYGIRKIRIPFLSIMIISLCSGIIILGSMYIGVIMLQFLPQAAAKMVGAFILMGIGVWAIIQMTLQKNNDPVDDKILSEKRIIHIEIKSLGLVIDILRTPSKADVDRSGNISASEATLLGIALSLDAFGAGIGAALIGFSPLITSLAIAVSSGVFLTLGLRAGYLFSNVGWVRRFSVLPGFILILMGVVKLFGV